MLDFIYDNKIIAVVVISVIVSAAIFIGGGIYYDWVEYEDMRKSRDEAENRANNWLRYFSIVLFTFVVLVTASVTFLMYMAAKNRRVENPIRLLDSINLSAQDKNLLISSLGGRLIEHPGKNDDEADKKEE